MNGIIRIGLNIIGAPKMAGSESRKKLGTIVAFPNAFICSDFAFRLSTHNPKVFPVPPKKAMARVIKIGWNTGCAPAAKSSALDAKAAMVIGLVTAMVTICPCTPQHQSTRINRQRKIAPGTEFTTPTGFARITSIQDGILRPGIHTPIS